MLEKFSRKAHRTEREIRIFFLIVCEGEKTEPNYFKSFPRKNMNKEIINVQCEDSGNKTSCIQIVEKAIDLKEKSNGKYDSVWVVFDKDNNSDESFHSAIESAERHNIKVAWSNEAFELWYILHFQYIDSAISRRQYKEIIENAISDKLPRGKFNYSKSADNMYSFLELYGNQENAINWAKKLHKNKKDKFYARHNPCTLVFKLVEELNGTSKELNNSLYK